jgi:hypothetical protein
MPGGPRPILAAFLMLAAFACLAAFTAAAAPAQSCAPKATGAKILRSTNVNDVDPSWAPPAFIGTSWSLVEIRRDGAFLSGRLANPRGGFRPGGYSSWRANGIAAEGHEITPRVTCTGHIRTVRGAPPERG